MIICVTAEGKTLDSQVDQRFGRSQFFIFYNNDSGEFEAVENANVNGTGGVGIQSAQLMAQKGAKTVLTGKVGPNASQTLASAGIAVVLDVTGTVKDALEQFKNGSLKSAEGPNTEAHTGIKNPS